jgi:hypothetical protein
MIRRTTRLTRQLQSNGCCTYWLKERSKYQFDVVCDDMEEAELDWPSGAAAVDFSVIHRFKNDRRKTEYGYYIKGEDAHDSDDQIDENSGDGTEDHDAREDSDEETEDGDNDSDEGGVSERDFDILWVSETEFISLHEINVDRGRNLRQTLYMEVQLGESLFSFGAFSSKPKLNAPAEAALSFLGHVLTPVLHTVSKMVITFLSMPPVDVVLSLIPTTANTASLTKNIEISILCPTEKLLQALSTHPVHHRVLLGLESVSDDEYSDEPMTDEGTRAAAEKMNSVLRELQHPVHLQVPHDLLDFEPPDETFAVNRTLESLTIAATGDQRISPKLLDDIARNKHITNLAIDYRGRYDDPPKPNWHKDIFRRLVLTDSSNIRYLTCVSHYNYVSSSLKAEQHAFDRLTKLLESSPSKIHGLSHFVMAFPYSRLKPLIKSNSVWDSRFSPALLLNCLHQQKRGRPSAYVVVLATQRINQGILYKNATSLVPWDLSISSATAIFDMFRCVVSRKELDAKENVDGKSALVNFNASVQELKEAMARTQSELDEFVASTQHQDQANHSKWMNMSKCGNLVIASNCW